MTEIQINGFVSGQEFEIYQFILKVYNEFVASDYTEAGNQLFYDWINPYKIAERQQKQRALWTAMSCSEMIGMIEMRDFNHVSLLFVDKKFHRKGIAKQLLMVAIEDYKQAHSLPCKFHVHASLYSVQVYKKLGFEETDGIQEYNGIKYVPMELIVK